MKVEKKRSSFLAVGGSLLISIVVIAAAIMFTMHLMKTSPKAKPRKKPVFETVVRAEDISFSLETVVVNAMGSVIPAREIELKPRVSGEVLSIADSMVPGGYLKKGDPILEIDSLDYKLEVAQLRGEVAKVKSSLSLEMGNQRVAQKEFELLGEEATEDEKILMLRTPQLNSEKASMEVAEIKLKKALIDLERTKITAPFNSVVVDRNVNVGTKVSESTLLAHLVDTDAFWLELVVPVDKLRWILLPEDDPEGEGSEVKIIFNGPGETDRVRRGHVVRVAADLEEKGRMARLYAEVKDPLSLLSKNKGKDRLFLGSYVQAEIEGITLDSVYRLQRTNLKDNDSIWLVDEQNSLELRPVEIVYRGNDTVLVGGGVSVGEKIITSNIAAPVSGMPLRLDGEKAKGDLTKGGMGNGGKKNKKAKVVEGEGRE